MSDHDNENKSAKEDSKISNELSNTNELQIEIVVPTEPDVQLIEDAIGLVRPSLSNVDSVLVKRFTWKTKNKLTVQLISFGATITCIQAPDRYGNPIDIVLGYDKVQEYNDSLYYFGSTIGRVANIIEEASFKIGSGIFPLSINENSQHINGGVKGFNKVFWDWIVEDTKVTLSYLSLDGEEGYPGSLLTQISYIVTVDNTLKIQMRSTTTKPTPVNISNQIYFNLGGHQSGSCGLYEHIVTINADKYCTVTDEQIPTGERIPVGGTLYDLRIPRMLLDVLTKIPGNGYNTNFCITKGATQELAFVSRVIHPKTGRVLEVYSDQPAIVFNTGNNLPDSSAIHEGESQEKITPPIKGKSGAFYRKHGGFFIQSQAFPNAVNEKRFPKVILYPGKEYVHNILFKFGLQLGKYC